MKSSNFTNWDGGYPTNNNSQQSCVANYISNGIDIGWKSYDCDNFFTSSFYYYCQITACDTDHYCP